MNEKHLNDTTSNMHAESKTRSLDDKATLETWLDSNLFKRSTGCHPWADYLW